MLGPSQPLQRLENCSYSTAALGAALTQPSRPIISICGADRQNFKISCSDFPARAEFQESVGTGHFNALFVAAENVRPQILQ